MKRRGPPIPKYPTGPRCGGCPYRQTSFGFAAPQFVEMPEYRYTGQYTSAEVMFLAEKLGPDEVEQGRNLVGGTGRIFNALLNGGPISRAACIIGNVVKCLPGEWAVDERGNQIPLYNDYNGSWVIGTPSPGQIRECAERYLEDDLAHFQGKTIVGLGGVALQYFCGRARKIGQYNGTVFEHGEMEPCELCAGTGKVADRMKKCPVCQGKLVVEDSDALVERGIPLNSVKLCKEHPKFSPARKPRNSCVTCWTIWHVFHPWCSECAGKGKTPKPPRTCPKCDGNGEVAKDPKNPYRSDKLRPGQIFYPVFHPIYLMKKPGLEYSMKRNFMRIAGLHEELQEQEANLEHISYPENPQAFIQSPVLSIDIEGPDAETYEGDITVVGVSPGPGRAVALHPDDPAFRKALEAPEIIGQNYLQYDSWVLVNRGYPRFKKLWDTRLAGVILNPDSPHDLSHMTLEYAKPPFRGYWKTKDNYRHHADKVTMVDVDTTYRVRNGQYDRLVENGQMHIMYETIELCNILLDMRIRGMKIDRDKMELAREEIEGELKQKRTALPWEMASGEQGTENQHKKVHDYLYETLRLPVQTKRGTSKVTADENAVETLLTMLGTGHAKVDHLTEDETAHAINFLKHLQELKDKSKLCSSFLKYKLSGADKVHPCLLPTAATLRFRCNDPNAQQIPKEGMARSMFIADYPEWVIVEADLKQAEIITFLWYAEEWGLLHKALVGGFDAHDLVADKTKLTRHESKHGVTFPVLYGETVKVTAARMGWDVSYVEDLRREYFKMLPGVPAYRETMIRMAQAQGYVETPFGYRRYVRVERPVGAAANQACNAPIQNVPSMITRRAMVCLSKELPKPARMLMQGHDSILVTCPRGIAHEVIDTMRKVMTQAIPEMPAPQIGMAGGLRFATDIKMGPSWGELEDV